jgi:Flp pilus assembly protein protease CpaA
MTLVDVGQHSLTAGLLSGTIGACWLITAWQDLRQREIALLPLIVLALISLPGHSYLWWLVVGVTFLWRWEPQRSLVIVPLVFVVGGVTLEYAPTMALVGGLIAWALGWWGGADGVLLAVLALRYDLLGLVAGAVVTAVFGLAFLAARRKLVTLVPALADVLAARPVSVTGPGSFHTEMPAATALAAAGVVLELIHLFF